MKLLMQNGALYFMKDKKMLLEIMDSIIWQRRYMISGWPSDGSEPRLGPGLISKPRGLKRAFFMFNILTREIRC